MDRLRREYNITLKKTDLIYTAILVCLFALFTEFFYRQCVRYNDLYISDTIVYAQHIGDVNNSRMVGWLFAKLHAINGEYYEIALFMSLVVVATIVACYFLIDYLLRREGVNLQRWKVQMMSFIALFSSAIYLPGIYEHFYSGTWSKYSWQSPTQQSMILFAVISLLLLLKLYDHYLDKITVGQWLGLTVMLLLTTWAKPSFLMVLAPTMIIVFIADLIRRNEYPFLQRLKNIIILGCSFIPAGLFMLLLNSQEFAGDENEAGVAINLGYFLEKIDHPALMIFLSLAFTIVVFAFNLKKFKERTYQIFGGMLLFGVAQYTILVETGSRINHGNFSWGREVGEFMIFMAALALAVANFKNEDGTFLRGKPALRYIYLAVIALLLAGQVISQLVYVYLLLKGNLYRM